MLTAQQHAVPESEASHIIHAILLYRSRRSRNLFECGLRGNCQAKPSPHSRLNSYS